MIVRIPEKHFETFLSDAEVEASKVLERNVTGQDVTEQYVDLSSRVEIKTCSGGTIASIYERCRKNRGFTENF